MKLENGRLKNQVKALTDEIEPLRADLQRSKHEIKRLTAGLEEERAAVVTLTEERQTAKAEAAKETADLREQLAVLPEDRRLLVSCEGSLSYLAADYGLDEAYPRRNRELFERLCAEHLVLSEWPPGTAPEAFRFPLRNRIIAALAEVLVVVESRERGGSLITARAALDRGVDVMVVPGSPRTRAATGTNQLLRDGAAPVTCVDDVLDVLSITGPRLRVEAPATVGIDDRVAAAVLERCRSGPATLDAVVLACAAPIATVAAAVATLLATGHLAEEAGWLEATGSRLSGSRRP